MEDPSHHIFENGLSNSQIPGSNHVKFHVNYEFPMVVFQKFCPSMFSLFFALPIENLKENPVLISLLLFGPKLRNIPFFFSFLIPSLLAECKNI